MLLNVRIMGNMDEKLEKELQVIFENLKII